MGCDYPFGIFKVFLRDIVNAIKSILMTGGDRDMVIHQGGDRDMVIHHGFYNGRYMYMPVLHGQNI